MYTLPAKTPTEQKFVTFDFTTEAVAGNTLSGPSVAKALLSGADPGAASMTIGSVVAVGLQVQALVSGGVDGAVYQLICTTTASNGEVHQIIARMAVNATAA